MPDRVDCVRLAEGGVVLERIYPLGEMPRLQDLLADTRGSVRAIFAFATIEGRAGANVAVEATPQLLCQRCLQGFAYAASCASDIEFASGEAQSANSTRELYSMEKGVVSLRDLAEEELLLALPIVAACSAPQACGRAPTFGADGEAEDTPGDRSRPFTGLQDLLKKT
ncbi:MAG: YceD family protein [Pseudomonadota bacterium]|nr:YceD family protein [Pseudomonadota bacterium]